MTEFVANEGKSGNEDIKHGLSANYRTLNSTDIRRICRVLDNISTGNPDSIWPARELNER